MISPSTLLSISTTVRCWMMMGWGGGLLMLSPGDDWFGSSDLFFSSWGDCDVIGIVGRTWGERLLMFWAYASLL